MIASLHPTEPIPLQDGERLKIVIVGHVDHGKSTLIGRLFFDTNSLPDGKVEQIRAACEAENMEFEYAFLLDALLEEQEQNITIDTTQIHFRTSKRNYVIIDAPGHKEFLKNMVTGAASASAAILLIDAKEGVKEQSRRHGYLLSLLGIKQIIVAVNKLDLVGYDAQRFEQIKTEFTTFLKGVGITPTHFIPISAKNGVNIASRSPETKWHNGPSLLEALDSFVAPASQTEGPLRLLVQDIYRFDDRRIIAGRIESGSIKVGQEVIFYPERRKSRVNSIEEWGTTEPPQTAKAGDSVAITLTEQIFVERGQVATTEEHPAIEAREIQARLFWLHDEPLELNKSYTLRLGTQSVEATPIKLNRVLDSSSLEIVSGIPTKVNKNEAAEITFKTRRPLAFDNSDVLNITGRFVVLQKDRIGGGGIIFGAKYPSKISPANITWTTTKVTRQLRSEYYGHTGAVLLLTGYSGSGKSTLATALEAKLFRRGVSAFVIDGDNLRHGLCSNLGFSPEDRGENLRRAGEVAKLLAEAGQVVICSLIAPYANDRERIRGICITSDIPYAEVFVDTPLEVCEKRDPRGLYKKARNGEIKEFTGISSPYEPPQKPELRLRTHEETLDASMDRLLDLAVRLSTPKPSVKVHELDHVPEAQI